MKTLLLLLALCVPACMIGIGIRAHYKTPLCRIVVSHCDPEVLGSCDSTVSEYWVSPFITNGNGVTHICAHIYNAKRKPDQFAVEIPMPGDTMVAYPLSHEAAMKLIEDHCRRGI